MSGTITAPQSQFINAGQVIEVRLPDIEGKDTPSPRRQSAELARHHQVNFTSNVADGKSQPVDVTKWRVNRSGTTRLPWKLTMNLGIRTS